MPKINARGDVITGVGGIQGALKGRPYPFRSEGRGCWLDDDTLLVAAVERGPGVWHWRPFADPTAADMRRLDVRPFNRIAGGGGRWAACVQGAPSLLFGSLGDVTNGGIPDVAPDGTILYPYAYPSDFGLTVVPPVGKSVSIALGVALYHHALPGGRAIWHGGAYGRPAPRPTLPAVDLRLVELAGVTWLLYWSEGVGIVLQQDGATEGYVIALPNGYDNDLIVRDGQVLAALGLSQGEGPNDYLLVEATRAGARYIGREGPPIVWQALGVVQPPKPPVGPPKPPTKPEEPTVDYLSIIKAVRAKYQTPLGARHWEFLVDVAQQTGTQLFRKEAGDNALIPPLGKRVSLDVIGRGTLGNRWADILGDAEGDAVPAFDVHDGAAGEYVDVSGVTLPGGPVQPPQEPPANPPANDLTPRVAALESALAALSARVDAIQPPPVTISEGRVKSLIADALANVTVVGSTNRVFAHAHDINVTLKPKA